MDDPVRKERRARTLTEEGTELYTDYVSKYTRKLSNIKREIEQEFIVYSSGLCNRDDIIALKNRLGNNFKNYQRVSQEYEAYLERIGTEESVKELTSRQLISQVFEEKCSAILQRLEQDLRDEPAEHKLPQSETSARDLPERGPSQRTSVSSKCGASHISSRHSRSSMASSILMKQKAKVEGARAKLEFTALEVQMKKEKMELEARLSMLAAKRDAEVAKRELEAMYDMCNYKEICQKENQLDQDKIVQERVNSYVDEQNLIHQEAGKNFNDPNSGQPTNFTETNHGQHINITETNNGQHTYFAETNNGQHTYFAETEQIPKLPARINVSHQPTETQGIIDSGNHPTQMMDLCAQFAKFMVKKDLLLSRLTAFNDSPELFASWKATFQNIASEMEVSATEEIDLLIKWLGPESSRQAQALRAAKAGDPRSCLKMIWDRLNERFGSPEMIRAAVDKRLANFQRIGKDLHRLYDLADLVTEINALKDDPRYSTLLAYYDSPSGVKPIVNKLPIILREKWTTEATRYKKKWEVLYPPFSYFAVFIRDLAVVRNDPSFTYDNPTTDTKKDEGTSVNARTKTTRPNITVRKTETKETSASQTLCPIHNTRHSLNQCRTFRNQPIGERKDLLFKKGLCFRCCGMEKHLARDCTVSVRCELCNVTDHPTALHVSSQDDSTKSTKQHPRKKASVSKSHGGESSGKETTPTDIKTSCTQVCGNPVATSKSCGKIVMAKLYPKGKQEQALTVYVIVDDQSNRTLGRSCIFDHFKEDSPALEYSMSSCAGTRIDVGRRLSNYMLESMDGSFETRLPEVIECNGIPDVREEIPTPEVTKHYKHLNDLTNLIQPVRDEVKISLLIGRDLPEVHHIMDQRTGKAGSPFAQKLRLGWVVVGETCLGAIHKTENVNVNKLNTLANGRPTCLDPCHNKVEINDESPIFFKSPDENKPGLSVRDRKFLKIMETEFMKNEEGSWTAPLPFIEPRGRLPNNREAALKRARSLEISMKRDSKKKEDMFTFMGSIIEKGHAEVAPTTPEEQEKWYLPLFGVYHPRKPDKIRGVFDSSAKFKGVSLNDSLLTGPNMTNNLVGVLLRFRKGSVAVAADVEHMFYCFVVRPEHREFLRFFWYKDNDFENQLMEYRMTRHVFGNGSSPAIATYGLRKVVEEADEDVQEFIHRNFYVDDGLVSLNDTEKAISLMKRTKACLQENGKLRLHKIISNEPAVLQAFDRSELAKEVKDLDLCKDDLPTQTSLGLFWDVNTDSFTFRVSSEVKPYTKRGVLSTINSLFDPVGFVAPVLIKGRLILRSCMSSPCDWDDPLPKELESIWREWTESLQSLRSLNIPRRYDQVKEETCVSTELHTFCDASKEAIGAVTYLRTVGSDGSEKLSFVLGKAKMAPHKGHTIPRLELCAAVLGTEVAQAAKEQLDINFDIEKYYTDSRIVLGYICNEERRFHVYVSNRVDRIRCVSYPDQWNHVGTDINPADLATRSVPANELKHSIWISGPTQFDFHPYHQSFPLVESETDKELYTGVVTSKTHVTTAPTLNVDIFKRFSSWRGLVKSIASFKVALRRRCGHQTADSTVNDLDIVKEAERVIIRSVQQDAYGKEIRCLQQEQKLHADSSILSLCPVLDTEGILRLEGRLKRTKCFSMSSNPIIIPKNQHIAVLLIRHFHENVHHQGRHITEGAVREGGLWIVGGKRQIASVIHNYLKCRRLRGKTALQKMADLPEDRTMIAPPFSYVGIDTFGPWTFVSRRTRGCLAMSKRWAILFTCLVVRAIHIEAVEELSASSFINALRRFIALRGPVQHFRSDRGTNFIGAARELGIQEIFAENKEVQDFLLQNQIKWIFNTPHSSHHGGVWERLIGVSRRVLDSMLLEGINKNLTHEVLVTFLAEVCAVVNSRPLVSVSTDPEAPEVLTPNLLLTQKPTCVDDMDLSVDTKNIYRRQWKLVQHLADAFWSRWKKEYLHTLQVRRKWQSDVPNIKENDIVLMKDDQVCRNEWPVAVVDRVFPSEDGRVRSVEIAIMKDGKRVNYVRPVTRLVVLSSD